MTAEPAPAPDVQGLLSDAIVYELWGVGDESAIHPSEEPLVADAVASRRAEFAAGRACARLALNDLGLAAEAILRAELRSPAWPTRATGSISHTDGYAVAAVRRCDEPGSERRRLLGVDAERLGRVRGELHSRLFTEVERSWLATIDGDADVLATAMFGCKESFYKAQFVASSAWVGFHDVEVRAESPDGHDLVFTLHRATDLDVLDAFDWPIPARCLLKDGVVVSALEVMALRA